MQGPGHGQRAASSAGGLNHLLSPRLSMSPPMEPGSVAPPFNLPNANAGAGADSMSLADAMGENGLIVAFTCNHCPYVVGSEPRIEGIAEKARSNGIGFVGINSNDPVMYEADSWDNMVKRASKGMTYPYLHDDSQQVATSYGAERTPEFYLLAPDSSIQYRGRLDDSPRDPSHASTSELSDAIDDLISGGSVRIPRTESIGCSVKWKT